MIQKSRSGSQQLQPPLPPYPAPTYCAIPTVVSLLILFQFSISQCQQVNFQKSNPPLSAFTGEKTAPGPFSLLWKNTRESFAGWNLALHAAGAGATWGLIETEADYHVHRFFHRHGSWEPAFMPVAIIGGLAPGLLPAGMYLGSRMRGNLELKTAGWAALQSGMLSLSYVSLLKFFTGRPHPDWENTDDVRALSRKFKWGLGRGGIFWGWPSGHTTTSTSLLATLVHYYPEKRWLKGLAYGYTLYGLAGVSAVGKGAMHWFSDAVAGTLMGYAIGSTVGKNFRAAYETPEKGGSSGRIQMVPVVKGKARGIGIVLQF